MSLFLEVIIISVWNEIIFTQIEIVFRIGGVWRVTVRWRRGRDWRSHPRKLYLESPDGQRPYSCLFSGWWWKFRTNLRFYYGKITKIKCLCIFNRQHQNIFLIDSRWTWRWRSCSPPGKSNTSRSRSYKSRNTQFCVHNEFGSGSAIQECANFYFQT
jgi:hypothetical protein